MDRSVKTPEDLERVTPASLGVIPAAGSVSRQYGYGWRQLRAHASVPRAVETGDKEPGVELIPARTRARRFRSLSRALHVAAARFRRLAERSS
jgi:hypothetical protein